MTGFFVAGLVFSSSVSVFATATGSLRAGEFGGNVTRTEVPPADRRAWHAKPEQGMRLESQEQRWLRLKRMSADRETSPHKVMSRASEPGRMNLRHRSPGRPQKAGIPGRAPANAGSR